MKICAVICEYNPFHNGHKYQLGKIREASGCDKIVCVMSGNFTQRGDMAVFDKFTRARHAVENGADVVLELPVSFAVSPAELFARGAVKIICSVPAVDTLAFGCESGSAENFLHAANVTLSESKEFKNALKENMKGGASYIKARTEAVLQFHGDVDEALLTSPNNILGTEYCRALLSEKSAIKPLPIPRIGGGYADTSLFKNFSSATALRACMEEDSRRSRKALKNNLPESVYRDALLAEKYPFEQAEMYALAAAAEEEIAQCPDCSEGLENRLKALAKTNPARDELMEKAVSKRYTLSRLKRILAQNLLKIKLKDVRRFLENPLYCNVLAVKKEGSDETLALFGEGKFPLVVRKSDAAALKKEAFDCFATDVRANDIYNALTGRHSNEYQTLFV